MLPSARTVLNAVTHHFAIPSPTKNRHPLPIGKLESVTDGPTTSFGACIQPLRIVFAPDRATGWRFHHYAEDERTLLNGADDSERALFLLLLSVLRCAVPSHARAQHPIRLSAPHLLRPASRAAASLCIRLGCSRRVQKSRYSVGKRPVLPYHRPMNAPEAIWTNRCRYESEQKIVEN